MKSFLDQCWENASHVLSDLLFVAMWLIAIWLVGQIDIRLNPPSGLVVFDGTDYAFKLKWVIQAGELGTIVTFLGKSIIKIAFGASEAKTA